MELFINELLAPIDLTDEEGIETIRYSEKENEKRCSITLEDFTIGRSVSKLQCGHIFQSEAIKKWLEIGHHECPLCRSNIHSNEFVTMASLLENIKKIRGFIVWFFDEMEALWDIRHG